MPVHVALLGDSIFDNAAYTAGEPDVVAHLRALLPAQTRATLYAVDGGVIADLPAQLRRLSRDVDALVIAVGGNDALGNIDLLGARVDSTAEALAMFGERVARFESAYRRALDPVLALGRATTLCTIYNGNLPAAQAPLARVALMLFNDAILRVAFEHGLAVIDLRLVCSEPEDYANPIEPSGPGGRKIATAIARALGVLAPRSGPSRVFAA